MTDNMALGVLAHNVTCTQPHHSHNQTCEARVILPKRRALLNAISAEHPARNLQQKCKMLHINQGGPLAHVAAKVCSQLCDAADQHRCRGCIRTPVQADAPVCNDNLLARIPLHWQTPAQHSQAFPSHALLKATAHTAQLSLRCLPVQDKSTPWACKKHWACRTA